MRQMQEIKFGRIERLAIRNGEPLLDPPPRIVREVKFGGENAPLLEKVSATFALKSQVIDLFRQLDGMTSGQIEVLEVKHGLPFRMLVEQ